MKKGYIYTSKLPLEDGLPLRSRSDYQSRDALCIDSIESMLGGLTDKERFLDRVLGEFCSEEKYQQMYGLGRYAEGGAPLGLRGVLSIVMFGKYKGIHSSRKLSEMARENLVCRYLSGSVTPSHNTINEFIKNNQEILQEFFSYSVRIGVDNNLINFNNVNIDGSKLGANASISFGMMLNKKIKDNEHLKALIQRYIDSVLKNDSEEDSHEEDIKRLEETIASLRSELDRLSRKNEDLRSEIKTHSDNGTYSSCVNDPDAKRMKSGHTRECRSSHNIQAGMDGQSNMIVSADSTDHSNDINQLCGMTEITKAEADRNGCRLDQVTADKGYGNIDHISSLEKEGITCNVDLQTTAERSWLSEHADIHTDPEADDENVPEAICPAGLKMSRSVNPYTTKRNTVWKFRLGRHACTGCPFVRECHGKSKSDNGKTLHINVNWLKRRKHLEKINTPQSRQKIARRKGHIEGVFGYLKHDLSQRPLTASGQRRVITRVKAVFSIYNLKRIINIFKSSGRRLDEIIVPKPLVNPIFSTI